MSNFIEDIRRATREGTREGIKKGINDIKWQQRRDANMREIEQAMKLSPLEVLLSAVIGLGLLGIFLILAIVIGGTYLAIAYPLLSWYGIFTELAGYYASYGINSVLIFFSVPLIIAVCYWVFCIFMAAKGNRKKTIIFTVSFAVLCITGYALPRIIIAGRVAEYLFNGVMLALIPALILVYIQYKVSGGRGFLHKIAYRIIQGQKKRGTIFAIFGVLAILFAVLMCTLGSKGVGIMGVIYSIPAFISGALFIYISIFGRKEPVIQKEEVKADADNTEEKEWFSLTAEYNGKTYQCSFDEDGQYQDVSSNEQFYYHGGVEPALGDKSGFYFLVFVTYDNYLATVIPFNGITPQNYDEKFNEMIQKFESSKEFKELSDHHMERCARLLMEEEGCEE